MMIKREEINFLFSKMKFNKSTLLGDLILSPHPTFTTYWRFTASLIPNTSSKTWKCGLNIGEEPVLLLFSLALLCYSFKVLSFDLICFSDLGDPSLSTWCFIFSHAQVCLNVSKSKEFCLLSFHTFSFVHHNYFGSN